MLGDQPGTGELSFGRGMSPSLSSSDYAGDLDPQEAWEMLSADPVAQLVDVRTLAEWNFVGLPDLGSLGRRVHCVEWQSFPSGALNAAFAEETAKALSAAGAGSDAPILLLCRSGSRSRAAAIALTAAGFHKAFNIAGGFEGDLDGKRHRGTSLSWKAAGLPWRQS